jgi:hypothetical protein
MRCPNCQAPRDASATRCPYCTAQFTPAQPANPGREELHPKWDLAFVQMRRQPRTAALLADRAGLPRIHAPSMVKVWAPLLVTSALAAAVLWTQRREDGTWAVAALVAAGFFVVAGLVASLRGARSDRGTASKPVEGHLVRLGLWEVDPQDPQVFHQENFKRTILRVQWIAALEDGSQRWLTLHKDARGLDKVARDATGVAWLQGNYLLGFEPVEV